MMMTSKNEQITEEQVKDNLENGLVMVIEEKKKEFFNKIDGIAKNISVKPNSKSAYALMELIRVLKSAATFPTPTLKGKPSERELHAVANLYEIKDLQIEMAICAIGRLQEEQDNNSQEESNE
jgi:hypothetical protein